MSADNFPDCSGQLGRSDSEEDKDALKTSRKKRLILESEDELSDQPEVKKTPGTSVQTSVQAKQRSSERIRDKLQRKHVRPSREEILDKIEVKNVNYENMSLTRRKVVNEFVKGSSRYVLDSIDVCESNSDDDDDFIDDSKIKGKKYSRARANNKRRRNIRKEFDEYSADDESYSNRKKKLVKKTCKKLSSDDEETVSDKNNASSEVNASFKHSPKQKHRNSKCMRSFPDDEKSCTSEENDISDINKSRKHSISNRIESSESEETLQDENTLTSVDVFEGRQSDDEETVSDKNYASSEVNTSFKHSPKQKHRNSKCLPSLPDDEKSCTSEENDISNINKSRKHSISNRIESSESEETLQDENILTSVDVFEARQSDDEFVVDDDDYCEESVNEYIRNAENMLGHNVFRANEKKSSSYQRICIPVQSDDSEADEFAVDSLQPVAYAMLTGHTDCLKLLLHGTSLLELNRLCETNFNFSLLHFVVCGKTTLPDLKCEFSDDFGLFQCLKMLCEHDKEVFMKLSNEKDSQGLTPLVVAIIARHCQCIEYLLQNGASADDFPKTNEGNLLHFAVVNCLTSVVPENAACLNALLYSASGLGHKVNDVDDSGFTPLMYAAQAGDHHCVKALLQAGASVTCKDLHGTTSLHLAAASGDTASVKLLLEYGHQVDCLDKCGWPPILYANFAAREDCVLALMAPNPRQIFVLGDLLQRGTSEAAKEKNFKVVKDVLVALANQDAYYRVFNDFVRRNPNFLDEYDQGLLNQTWRALLDYDNKLGWFKRKLAKLRKGFCVPFPLIVNREAVFESAMTKLGSLSGSDLRKCRLEVTFNNEEGICTGPKKEFFVNICKDVVDEQRKLFHLTDDNQYSFVPNAHFAELAKIQGGGPIKNEINNDLDSSPNVKSSSGTDGEVIMDDEDRIIAELDISEFDFSLPNSQSKKNMNKNPDETKRQEFARHIDEKLIKNISQLKFLGKIIGLSICEGVFISLNLCKPLVKQILGIELSHPDDLGSFDFKLHENLITFVLESDDVDELELPCTLDVINPWNSRPTSLTLFSDERNDEMLSEENKIEFVHCVSEYKLQVLIKRELDAVRDGINEVIPRSLLSLFTADEFSLLINGIGTIDVQDWRTNTQYTPADAENTRNEIKWFWEVVNGLKEEEKALLLKFSTGSPCLPAGGFAHLQGLGGRTRFHISMKSERNKIPTASTCFNQLKIPQYDSLKDLRDKLLIAIRHGAEGFSFS